MNTVDRSEPPRPYRSTSLARPMASLTRSEGRGHGQPGRGRPEDPQEGDAQRGLFQEMKRRVYYEKPRSSASASRLRRARSGGGPQAIAGRGRRLAEGLGEGHVRPAHADDAAGFERLARRARSAQARRSPRPSSRPSPRRGPTATSPRTPSITPPARSRASPRGGSPSSRRRCGNAEVIDPPTSGDRVTFASTVLLEDENGKGDPLPDRRLRRGRSGARAASRSCRRWPGPSSARASATRVTAQLPARQEDVRHRRGRTSRGRSEATSMPTVRVDGVNLYYEESGQGTAAGLRPRVRRRHHRSWHLQMRFFSRRYRARSPSTRAAIRPSDVPDDVEARTRRSAPPRTSGAMLDAARRCQRPTSCGLSMGGFATLHFGLRHPDRALSLVVAGAGYGSVPGERDKFRQGHRRSSRAASRKTGW